MSDLNSPCKAEDFVKSKSQRKRDMHDLQLFSKDLINLPLSDIKQLGIDNYLLNEIKLAKKIINQPTAFNRQLQFITKCISNYNTIDLQDNFLRLKNLSLLNANKLNKLNALFKDLLQSGDNCLTLLLQENPDLDRQLIRQLLRKLQKEKHPYCSKSENGKKLFNYLRSNVKL